MHKKSTILLAEDEEALGLIVKESLESRNFEVLLCKNGNEALEVYKSKNPDLLVLDVMMPQKDGFTLAEEIRKQNKDIPIIFLTAKSQTKDVVNGFKIGGNDYLKKPFSIEELIVRIENLLLSNSNSYKAEKVCTLGNYQFDMIRQTLQYKKESATNLTHKETKLLQLFVENQNSIIERSLILNTLWETDDFFSARSMDVFISKLRKKLNKDNHIKIMNIRGIGFKMLV